MAKDKKAATRGDLVNNANARLEEYRHFLYPIAVATLAGTVGAGGSQLYKYITNDRFKPDALAPDPEDSQEQRRKAIDRFKRESSAVWDKSAATDGKTPYENLSFMQRVIIPKNEYEAAKPKPATPKHRVEAPSWGADIALAGGMLGAGLLANHVVGNTIEKARVRRAQERALLAELEMRRVGEDLMSKKTAARVYTDEAPSWGSRLTKPLLDTAWVGTLGALGAGTLTGFLATRGAFGDKKREDTADKIKTWMQGRQYEDFQDALTDDYLAETGPDEEKIAKEGTPATALPFEKFAAPSTMGQVVGGIGVGAIGAKLVPGIGWVAGADDLIGMATGHNLGISDAMSHVGGTAVDTGYNAVSNIARGRGLAGMVTDNLDSQYNEADTMTRHKMVDAISKGGENLGSSGPKIRKSMESIANNKDFQRGLTGGASERLGAGQSSGGTPVGAKEASWDMLKKNLSDTLSKGWESVKDTAGNAVSAVGTGLNDLAGSAVNSMAAGAKNLYNKVDTGIGMITGNNDPEVTAKEVGKRIPGMAAKEVGKFADKITSNPSEAENFGRGLANGQMNMKMGADAPDNIEEYSSDVAEGVAEGIKSQVGNKMQNRASGMAVNLAVNPTWHKGMFNMAGQVMSGALGLNGLDAQNQQKQAAGGSPLSHAFRAAGKKIGESDEMTQPMAKALNDSVVPDVAKNVADTYVPEGSLGGLGTSINQMFTGAFAGSQEQGA